MFSKTGNQSLGMDENNKDKPPEDENNAKTKGALEGSISTKEEGEDIGGELTMGTSW